MVGSGQPAARSPRSCTRRAATSSSPAAARAGRRGGSAATTRLVAAGGGRLRRPRRGSYRSPAARLWGNVQASGHDGGHDLHYRTLHAMGVTLLGHFLGADGRERRFAHRPRTRASRGATSGTDVMGGFRKHALERGLPWRTIRQPEPIDAEPVERVSLRGLGAVVFAGGFRPDYGSWVECPRSVREGGSPSTERGQHRGPRPLLRRRALPAEAQVLAPHRCGRGRRDRRPPGGGDGRDRLTSGALGRHRRARGERSAQRYR